MFKYSGIIPPLITPLSKEGELDEESLNKLIEHEIKGGVSGIFIMGTTGEGPSMDSATQKRLIETTCKIVSKRIKVLVGITNPSFNNSISLADIAYKSGADAVVLASPFYFPISQMEIFRYLKSLIAKLSLPVFLYNIPSCTKVSYSIEMLKELLPMPKVVGFKDSSGDFTYFQKLKILTDKLGLPLFMGPEELLFSALSIGAAGGVPGGANIFPKLFTGIFNDIKDKNQGGALKKREIILKISNNIYDGGEYGGSNIINGIKESLEFLKICKKYLAYPLNENLNTKRTKKIQSFITENRKVLLID